MEVCDKGGRNTMAKTMKRTAIISVIATIIFSFICWKSNWGWTFSAAITFGTIAYHIVIRLLVGTLVDCILHNRVDYNKKWFHVYSFEMKIYNRLKVKKWKGKIPTYNEELFSIEKRTFHEIAQATCQSEIVHEINAVLSFLPLFTTGVFGSFMVFLITSFLASCFDLMFVIVQRYNRPLLVKLAKRRERHKEKG